MVENPERFRKTIRVQVQEEKGNLLEYFLTLFSLPFDGI